MRRFIRIAAVIFCWVFGCERVLLGDDGGVTEYFGVGSYKGGERCWYFREYDNTVAAYFENDGENIGANRYSAFGRRISSVGADHNREAFQGLELDEDADHYNLGARQMRQEDGQWLQAEPMVIAGLAKERLSNPLQFNAYRYAANNPTAMTDPSGWATLPTRCAMVPVQPTFDQWRQAEASSARMQAQAYASNPDQYGLSPYIAAGYATWASWVEPAGPVPAYVPGRLAPHCVAPVNEYDAIGFGMPIAIPRRLALGLWEIPLRSGDVRYPLDDLMTATPGAIDSIRAHEAWGLKAPLPLGPSTPGAVFKETITSAMKNADEIIFSMEGMDMQRLLTGPKDVWTMPHMTAAEYWYIAAHPELQAKTTVLAAPGFPIAWDWVRHAPAP